jgi:hypothetical protein
MSRPRPSRRGSGGRSTGALALALALASAPVSAAPFAYLFNSAGDFLKLDLAEGRTVAAWSLVHTRGIGDALPEGQLDGPVVEGLTFDSERGNLFLVLPEEGATDDRGAKRFRVVATSLPLFPVRAEFRLPEALPTPPRLLLGPAGDTLYVAWESAPTTEKGGAGTHFHATLLSVPDLHIVRELSGKVARSTATGQDEPPLITERAYFGTDPALAFETDRLLRFSGGGFFAETSLPRLSAEQQTRINAYAGSPSPATGGPATYEYFPVGSQSGKTLVKVSARAAAVKGDLLFVWDPLTGTIGPLFEVPRSSPRLLDSGRRVLAQEIDGPSSRPLSQIRTTGRLFLFNVTTGNRLAVLSSDLLAGRLGEIDFICATPDGKAAFLRGAGNRIVLVDLAQSRVLAPPAAFTMDRGTRCAFTAQ